MRCIFCLEEKPPSLEHIIPLSLGGSVVTDRVCKECNSFLGSNIDAPLIEFLPIMNRRAELRLAGNSGRVPAPLEMLLGRNQELVGETVQRVRAVSDPVTGMIQHRLIHSSKEVELPDGTTALQISVDASDRDQIPLIIQRARKRKGLQPLSDEMMAAELAKLEVKTIENPVIKVSLNVDFSMLRHAMLKMAYEFAFIWIGDEYLDDPIASELREAIMSTDQHSTDAIRAVSGPAEESPAFNFWTPHPSHHLAFANAIQGSIHVAVRIFDVLAVAVPVTNQAAKYVRSPNGGDKLRFVAMDATNKNLVNTTLMEELLRIGREMTRLQRVPPFPDPLAPTASF